MELNKDIINIVLDAYRSNLIDFADDDKFKKSKKPQSNINTILPSQCRFGDLIFFNEKIGKYVLIKNKFLDSPYFNTKSIYVDSFEDPIIDYFTDKGFYCIGKCYVEPGLIDNNPRFALLKYYVKNIRLLDPYSFYAYNKISILAYNKIPILTSAPYNKLPKDQDVNGYENTMRLFNEATKDPIFYDLFASFFIKNTFKGQTNDSLYIPAIKELKVALQNEREFLNISYDSRSLVYSSTRCPNGGCYAIDLKTLEVICHDVLNIAGNIIPFININKLDFGLYE